MKKTLTLIPLIVCFSLLIGYNFMSAQWSAPTATAPGSNTAAPINVGSTTQAKSGNFMSNIVAAATSTWSPRYCNAEGTNCSFSMGGTGRDVTISSVAPTLLLDDNTTDASGFGAQGSRSFLIHANSNRLYALVDRDDDGVFYEAEDAAGYHWPMEMYAGTTTADDFIKFSNQVRAASFCDQNGQNCTSSSGMGGGSLKNGLVYKICSVLVGGNWRDTIVVPGVWTSSACQSFMTAVGATSYAFGCIAGDKFYVNDDVACDGAVAEPMPSRKFCSVVAASGNWRDTILVPSSFGDSQCANFQTTTGAAGRQMGCLTDTGVTFGNTSACNTGGSTAAQDLKFCTVALSGNWRDSFNVPASWDVSVCTSYGTAIGVTGVGAGYGLGCVLPGGVIFGSTRSCS